jgi:hypothetical protein
MPHSTLNRISIIAVTMGFISWVVGGSVIALFGFNRVQYPDSFFGPTVTGINPFYWVGASIIITGLFAFVGGIIIFFLSKLGKLKKDL